MKISRKLSFLAWTGFLASLLFPMERKGWADLYQKDLNGEVVGARYIQTTHQMDQGRERVIFEICPRVSWSGAHCTYIGRPEGYSIEELRALQAKYRPSQGYFNDRYESVRKSRNISNFLIAAATIGVTGGTYNTAYSHEELSPTREDIRDDVLRDDVFARGGATATIRYPAEQFRNALADRLRELDAGLLPQAPVASAPAEAKIAERSQYKNQESDDERDRPVAQSQRVAR